MGLSMWKTVKINLGEIWTDQMSWCNISWDWIIPRQKFWREKVRWRNNFGHFPLEACWPQSPETPCSGSFLAQQPTPCKRVSFSLSIDVLHYMYNWHWHQMTLIKNTCGAPNDPRHWPLRQKDKDMLKSTLRGNLSIPAMFSSSRTCSRADVACYPLQWQWDDRDSDTDGYCDSDGNS